MTFAVPDDLATGDVFPEAWADQVRDNFTAMSTWATYTPVLTQSATITKTVNHAYYIRLGDLIIGFVKMTPSASGTLNNAVLSSLPVAHALSIDSTVGLMYYFDNGTANRAGTVQTNDVAGTTAVKFISAGDSIAFGASGSVMTQVASGDILDFTFIYRAQ